MLLHNKRSFLCIQKIYITQHMCNNGTQVVALVRFSDQISFQRRKDHLKLFMRVYSVPAIFFFKVSMSAANSFLLSCNWSKRRRTKDIYVRELLCITYVEMHTQQFIKIKQLRNLNKIKTKCKRILYARSLYLSYLEEEVAVHEPAGVAEPNELQDLGELLKNTTADQRNSEQDWTGLE